MTVGKRFLCLGLSLLLVVCLSGFAEERDPARDLIERMVISYAAYGERDTQALEDLSAADPALAGKWTRIMDLWETPVEVRDELPDDLPGDDSPTERCARN